MKIIFKGKEKNILGYTLSSIVMTVFGVIFSYCMADLINVAIDGKMADLLKKSILAISILLLCQMITYFNSVVKNRLICRWNVCLRETVFKKDLMYSISEYGKNNSARYVNELITDCDLIDELVFQNTFYFIDAINQFLIVSVFVFFTNITIFVVMLLLTIITGVFMHLGSGDMQKLGEEYASSKENYYAYIKDIFANFVLIKLFGIAKPIEERYMKKNTALFEIRRIQQNKYVKKNIIAQLAGLGSTLLIMAITSFFALKGMVTVGFVVVAGELIGKIIYPITIFPSLIMNFQTAIPIVERIGKKEVIDKDERTIEEVNLIHSIQLNNIFFKYESSENVVIKNVTHLFEKGKKYLIVGESGCGKSTLLKIVADAVCGYEGEKLINGILSSEFSKEELMKKIGYLTQEILLIDDTVLNNLTLFKTIDYEKILAAIKVAGLDACELESGLETPVGEGGNKFSGGEKQRIALARMLLHDFEWILLDEFTANIDVEKSNMIEDNILRESDISVINVSHRLNKKTINMYDEIIMMDGGQIIEYGTFEDLMNKKGKFYATAMLHNLV